MNVFVHTVTRPTIEPVLPLSEHPKSRISPDNNVSDEGDDDIPVEKGAHGVHTTCNHGPAKGETQQPDTQPLDWVIESGLGWVDNRPPTLQHTDWSCTCNFTMPLSKDVLHTWCVKDIKYCLFQADLNQYGLKKDLVDRLYNFIMAFKATNDPVVVFEPVVTPEPVATIEPVVTPEPVATIQPAAVPNRVATELDHTVAT